MTDRDPAVVNAGGALNTLVSAPMTFRNAIINGAFDVWQRSTDATVTGSDSYASADRWRLRTAAGAGSVRSSRQSTGLNGFQYCMRFQRVSGNTNTAQLQLVQTLETSNSIPLVGGNVVLSFWARAGANYSPTSSALSVNLVSGTGTDQYWLSFTGAATVISTTATLSSTWQRFIYIGTPATTATQFYVQFEMNPTGTAGANDFFEITGVQLEQNSQATPFERRPIGVELALCQRYFMRFSNTGQFYGVGQIYPTNNAYLVIPLPVPMRVAPTGITASGTFLGLDSSGIGRGFSTPIFAGSTVVEISLSLTGGFNFTSGHAVLVFSSGATSVEVTGAEL